MVGYNRILFTVQGEPKGKGRPRFTKAGHTYTPSDTKGYESLVALSYQTQAKGYKFTTPVRVAIVAYHKLPKKSKKVREDMLKWRILPTRKPDVDNIAKIILDALNGVAWDDDAQVVELSVVKSYMEQPYVMVCVESLDARKCQEV